MGNDVVATNIALCRLGELFCLKLPTASDNIAGISIRLNTE